VLAHPFVQYPRGRGFRAHNEMFAAAARVLTEREVLESLGACGQAEEASVTRGHSEQQVPAIRQREATSSSLPL
jgi:hypothetical protein